MVALIDLLDEKVETSTEDGMMARNDPGLEAGLEGDVLPLSRLHIFKRKNDLMYCCRCWLHGYSASIRGYIYVLGNHEGCL